MTKTVISVKCINNSRSHNTQPINIIMIITESDENLGEDSTRLIRHFNAGLWSQLDFCWFHCCWLLKTGSYTRNLTGRMRRVFLKRESLLENTWSGSAHSHGHENVCVWFKTVGICTLLHKVRHFSLVSWNVPAELWSVSTSSWHGQEKGRASKYDYL